MFYKEIFLQKGRPAAGRAARAEPGQEATGPERASSGKEGASKMEEVRITRWPLTVFLLAINILIWAGITFSKSLVLMQLATKSNAALLQGQWWRFLTAGYLHQLPLHLLMNGMAIWNLCPLMEEFYGVRRTFVIYTTATITGFLLSFFWTPALSLGASAGIFGLMGALIAVDLHHKTSFNRKLQVNLLLNAGFGLFIGSLSIFPMDNAAHLGGLVGGFLCGWLAGLPRPYDDEREKIWSVANLVCWGLTIYAFYLVLAIWWQIPTMKAPVKVVTPPPIRSTV